MSVLTEVVVWVDCMRAPDDEPTPEDLAIHAALTRPIDGRQSLAPLDVNMAGGQKVFCGQVYAACFNYVSPERVVEHLREVPWEFPAVAIIDYEHDDGPRVHRFDEPRVPSTSEGEGA